MMLHKVYKSHTIWIWRQDLHNNPAAGMSHSLPFPISVLIGAALSASMLGAVAAAHGAGWIIGNGTLSVRPGLYYRSTPETATHVTFCLGERHRDASWYGRLCSPDLPDGKRILKRITAVNGDQVIVEGDGPNALDSRFLGPVLIEEIHGWWRPVVQIGGRQ